MARIEIQILKDVSECECCGISCADGACITIDGQVAVELTPVADCFDGRSFDDEDICAAILRHLGHNLVYSSESGAYGRTIKALGHSLHRMS
ncbi:hypothetical protein G6L37_02420 [Agrobacterium rubi]|nr:hypothetical protein [Agrobacterium rubi]NTF24250.1 hypothetical protein [Agrobacterium rubi]